MNNIYKVIWSKAKNCYVVASEIARSHTKSATGSGKIGGVTRRSLLASLMALSLLCGGLGVASAANGTVHVAESSASSDPAVYTTEKVDTLLKDKADKTALDTKANETEVVKNTENIATNKENIQRLDTDKLSKDAASATYATNKALNDLENAVTNKVDESVVEEALDGKANTDLSNLTPDGVNKIKETMSADMENKANKDTVTALVGRVGGLEATVGGASRGLVKGVADLNAKTTKITYDAALGTSVDGVTFNAGAVTGVTSINGTKIGTPEDGKYISQDGSIWGNMKKVDTQVETNVKNIETNKTAITNLDTGLKQEVKDRIAEDTALSDRIGTVTKDGNYIKESGTNNVSANLKVLDARAKTNTDAIAKETADREAAIGELAVNGNYIKKGMNVSDNLVELDTRAKTNADNIQTNANNIKNNKDEIARVNGELVKTNDYFNAELGKTNDYFNAELGKTNKHFNTELGKTNAALQATNKRTAGIERTGTGVAADNQTVIEGNVRFDQNGNVSGVKDLQTDTIHATGEIISKGLDAVDGDIKTNGKVSAGDVSTGTLKTTGKATIGGDLTVDGKLNVGEIYMEHKKQESTGEEYDSATSITADGISNNAKVTDRNGVTTESKFTHDKEGSTTYAKKGDDADWKEATSNVTADGVENIAKDSKGNNNTFTQTSTDTKNTLTDKEGNTSTTRQDSKGIYGYAKDKDGNKSYTKQEGNRIAESVIGQDGKETKSEMTSTDITNTAKDGTITNTAKKVTNEGTESVTNKVGNNEVKVSQNGVDIKAEDGKKITESVGTASRVVENDKITDEAGDSTVTTEKGKGTTFGKEGSTGTTNIYGDSIKTGTINAKDTTTDKLTAGAAAGANGGRLTVDADGVKGSYKSGDYTSRSYILDNTLKSGVDNGKEPIDADFVGSRTDHYMDGDKAKLDETVKDADGSNVTNKTSTSTTTTITDKDGNTTSSEMTSTIITNKAADTIKDKAGDYTVTTDKDNGTTFGKEGSTKTTNIKEDNVTTGTIKATDTITGTLTAGVGEMEEGSRLTVDDNGVKGSVKSGKYTSKSYILKDTLQSGVDNGKEPTAADFVGSRTDHYMDGDKAKLDETVKDADGSNVTKKTSTKTYTEIKDTNGNTLSVNQKADGNNYKLEDQDGNTNHVTNSATQSKQTLKDKDGNTLTTNQTATKNNFDLKSADGSKENHTTNTVDESRVAIKGENGKAELSTTDEGTTFKHSAAKKAFTEGGATNTTIMGNTITTGKVTMDYADVMRDLGVRGNATVDKDMTVKGNTTLGEAGKDTTLTVNSKATFKEIATFENGAEVKNGLTVSSGGLNVTGESTFNDKVTMKNGLDVTGGVASDSFTVKGTDIKIDSSGINAGGTVISNVADGSISEGSKDAVNGGQLYQVKNDLEGKVNKVGANAAAMANLHPMEFDPDSKWNIAAAMGNYGSETATAIGAFYRPNEDVMVNFSTAFGTGENMVGGGVSVRLGKGSNKLSREESNALKAQVNDLTARMDALLSVLNPNMSKDFPDVPENHWAYEAVSRLAGNDIVQGYPDGEFHGERTMTRYEMAEIIYNALSRGAEAEKELVEEFKPELQAMAASEKATAERAEG